METSWEKFKTDIYERTMDGKGKNLIKEFNLLDDCVEVYFTGNWCKTISLLPVEFPDVKAFEKEMFEKGVLANSVERIRLNVDNFLKRNPKDWVMIPYTEVSKMTSYKQKLIHKIGIEKIKGLIIGREQLKLFNSINGYGVSSKINYEELNLD